MAVTFVRMHASILGGTQFTVQANDIGGRPATPSVCGAALAASHQVISKLTLSGQAACDFTPPRLESKTIKASTHLERSTVCCPGLQS